MKDVAQLIHKYLKEELNEEELQQLKDWQQQSEGNRRIFKKLTDDEYLLQAVTDSYKIDSDEAALQKINVRIDAGEQAQDTRKDTAMKPIWLRLTVAAAILMVFAITVVYTLRKNHQDPGMAQVTNSAPDIAPGSNKATLKLADGRSILLDSAILGQLAQQGNTQVLNKDGQLVYTSSLGKDKEEVLWNTLFTTKGQSYPLLLSDGSQVILNAASSIRFPVSFNGHERRVEITGEVFFKVTHDASRPFKVTAGGMDIQVLGTTFNVNAYAEEEAIKATLVEGSIEVRKGIQKKTIKPGQQAQVLAHDIKITEVDVDKVIAWKQGFFRFKEDKLAEVMKSISRWYNVDVVFEGNAANVDVSGDIPRTANLSELIKLLAVIDVEARVEGQKLILKAQ